MKEILLTSSILILALLLLRVLFRSAVPRRVQYALWLLVLVRLLVPVNLPAVNFSLLTAAARAARLRIWAILYRTTAATWSITQTAYWHGTKRHKKTNR